MRLYPLIAIPFFAAALIASIEIVSFPRFTTVWSEPWSLLLLLGAGFFFFSQWFGMRIYLPKRARLLPFAAFVFYHIAAGVVLFPQLAAYVFDTRLALQKYVTYLVFLLIMLAVAIYIYNVLLRRQGSLRILSHVLFAAFLIEMAYSFFQFLKMVGVPFAVELMTEAGLVFGRGEEGLAAYWLKLYGMTGEPSALANFVLFMFPWLLVESCFLRRTRTGRCLLFCCVVLGALVFFFTFSRTAYFGAALSLLAGALLFARETVSLLCRSFGKVVLFAALGMAAIAVLPSYISSVWDAPVSVDEMASGVLSSFLDEGERNASGSNITRTSGMVAAINIFADHPVFGVGFGTQPLYQRDYLPEWARASEEYAPAMMVVDPKTHLFGEMPAVILTKVLAEGGIIGMALWIWMFGTVFFGSLCMARGRTGADALFAKSIAWMCVISQIVAFNTSYFFAFQYVLLFPLYWEAARRVEQGEALLSAEGGGKEGAHEDA